MKRWTATFCGLAAAALVATASSADAQQPGRNGVRLFDPGIDNPQWGPFCVTPPRGSDLYYYQDVGGVAFMRGGQRLAALVNDNPASAVTPSPGDVAVLVAEVAPCTPSHITNADYGTTLSYSPDGTQLALTQGGDINIVDAGDGRLVRHLTPNLASTVETDPTWDPKGTGVAYQASDGLRVRPPTGGASRLLVKGAARHADWSPDGKKIAYLDGGQHIAYYTLATRTVTRTPIVAQTFTWSPDGTSFFFGTATGPNLTCATATITGRITSRQSTDPCTALGWQPLR